MKLLFVSQVARRTGGDRVHPHHHYSVAFVATFAPTMFAFGQHLEAIE